MKDKLTERLKKLDVTILAAKDLLGAMKELLKNKLSDTKVLDPKTFESH